MDYSMCHLKKELIKKYCANLFCFFSIRIFSHEKFKLIPLSKVRGSRTALPSLSLYTMIEPRLLWKDFYTAAGCFNMCALHLAHRTRHSVRLPDTAETVPDQTVAACSWIWTHSRWIQKQVLWPLSWDPKTIASCPLSKWAPMTIPSCSLSTIHSFPLPKWAPMTVPSCSLSTIPFHYQNGPPWQFLPAHYQQFLSTTKMGPHDNSFLPTIKMGPHDNSFLPTINMAPMTIPSSPLLKWAPMIIPSCSLSTIPYCPLSKWAPQNFSLHTIKMGPQDNLFKASQRSTTVHCTSSVLFYVASHRQYTSQWLN